MLKPQGKWSAQPAGRARTCLEASNANCIVMGVSLGRTRSQEALSVYHVLLGHTRHILNRRRARYAPTVTARRQLLRELSVSNEAPPRAISVKRVLLGRTQQIFAQREHPFFTVTTTSESGSGPEWMISELNTSLTQPLWIAGLT